MAYVGQCSISKYRAEHDDARDTKVETQSVEPKSPPAETIHSLRRQKTVEGEDKIDEKTGEIRALDPNPICGESVAPVSVTKKQTFKCVYVGSSDHLSEKENLRDVIHLTEDDQAIVDECLRSNFN
ncbi:hypothetical protein DdX_13226 [Ditylenchus destructor]|uniref:Uncharacterized protein n=1 Tax=Ditylenchus destructor TaxID=166010 RepID=A0AAD4MWS9_9BILA|nr:hypothetical protein DdX_13226 [Ditylenchus destructor]